MRFTTRFHKTYIRPDEEQVGSLRATPDTWYTVEARPPDEDVAPAVQSLIDGIRETRTKWLGLSNQSPVTAFEIRRTQSDQLRFQYSVSTKRLDRKVRAHLTQDIPGIGFDDGYDGLPVTFEETIGGALVTTGTSDWYCLETEFDFPSTNSIAGILHRHAMRDTKFVVQILFQPYAGHRFRRKFWRKRAYKEIDYLRKEKEKLWGSRKPTSGERQKAKAIEEKLSAPQFKTSIRLLVIGAGDYTGSRINELAAGFNTYQNPETGQYLRTAPVTPIRSSQLQSFCKAVAHRRFGGWSRSFRASPREVANIVSVPDRQQENIQRAKL